MNSMDYMEVVGGCLWVCACVEEKVQDCFSIYSKRGGGRRDPTWGVLREADSISLMFSLKDPAIRLNRPATINQSKADSSWI